MLGQDINFVALRVYVVSLERRLRGASRTSRRSKSLVWWFKNVLSQSKGTEWCWERNVKFIALEFKSTVQTDDFVAPQEHAINRSLWFSRLRICLTKGRELNGAGRRM